MTSTSIWKATQSAGGVVPELARDQRQADLRGADLTGRDLSDFDFSGANLTGARLSGAKLRGSDFRGAILIDAQLVGCDLSSADLTECSAAGAVFGEAELEDVSFFGADLTGTSFSGSRLCRVDLRAGRLSGARFLETEIIDCDLARSTMSNADLTRAVVSGTDFTAADLAGARMKGLRGFEHANWIDVAVVDIDFAGAYLVRREIMDQNYLHEFRSRGRKSEVLFQLWRATSDCGRSFARWGLLTAAMALVFGVAYTQVDLDYGAHETALSPFYFSVVTLTTLGYGDVLPASTAAQILVLLEVVLGYVMLGGVLSIFATRMGRRAD